MRHRILAARLQQAKSYIASKAMFLPFVIPDLLRVHQAGDGLEALAFPMWLSGPRHKAGVTEKGVSRLRLRSRLSPG